MTLRDKNDFDSRRFFDCMIQSGFMHDDTRLSWVFELGSLEVHVMERDVLYVYDEGVPGHMRIELQSYGTIEKAVGFVCGILVDKVLSS